MKLVCKVCNKDINMHVFGAPKDVCWGCFDNKKEVVELNVGLIVGKTTAIKGAEVKKKHTEKELLQLAGKLAYAAGKVINSSVYNISERMIVLEARLEAYNAAIVENTNSK